MTKEQQIQQYQDYAQHVGTTPSLSIWIEQQLTNYINKSEHDVPTEEVEHIIDWIVMTTPKNLHNISYLQAKIKTEKWNEKLQKDASNITELPEDTEVILDFKDGFKIVKLIGENAYKREGMLMGHCVASYYGRDVEVYSLRDEHNNPHCTMEKDQQVKGKGNGDIDPKYIKYVVKFLEWSGMEVGDSEMKHLGYINVNKFKKYLHKDTKFFNKKYWYKNNQLLDKDGVEFASFDLLDQIPLLDEKTLKLNFELESFIKLSIDFLFKTGKKKNIASGDYSKAASSGDYSTAASSGYYSTAASSGDYSTAASLGDSSKAASSGDYSTAASSGDYSTAASLGDSSKAASSGDYSTAASSGYYSTAASSGDYSTAASSGDYSTAASSGDSSKAASSGDSSKAASSGDYSTAASSGDYSTAASSGYYSTAASSGYYSTAKTDGNETIACALGYKTKAKGTIGSWIVLTEYSEDHTKILTIESAKIDGKKLKPRTWYQLKNKKFVEVK